MELEQTAPAHWVADLLIALVCYAIVIILIGLFQRRDNRRDGVLMASGLVAAFLIGTLHLQNSLVGWQSPAWTDTFLKLLAATAAGVFAVRLWKFRPGRHTAEPPAALPPHRYGIW